MALCLVLEKQTLKGLGMFKDFERDFMNKLFPEGDDKFDEVMSEFTE